MSARPPGGSSERAAPGSDPNARRGAGTSRVFVGMGGNEGDRLAHLRRAVERIDQGALPGTRPGAVTAVSAVVETRAVGPDPAIAGGPYLNAAIEVCVDADASPDAIVQRLLELEAEHGRVRRARWAARPLDLDLLLVLDAMDDGGWVAREWATEHVTLPHPRMMDRDFVLAPLSELLPDEPVLDGRTAGERLAALREEDRTILRRLSEPLRGAVGDHGEASAPADIEAAEAERPRRLTSGERQRQSAALGELAKSLVAMNHSQLAQVSLPDEVREEVLVCRNLGRGARARQLRRIAQLLRAHDVDEIRATAEDAGHKQRRRAARERIYEQWRERLVDEKDTALTEFVEAHPMADPQRLHQLLRQARRDPGSGKSKQALRAVLQLVRETFEAEAATEAAPDPASDRASDPDG